MGHWNYSRNAHPQGPDGPLGSPPVVTKCALCDAVIDDGKSVPEPTIMRCPRCGPVCLNCARYVWESTDNRGTAWFTRRCGACGAEVEVANDAEVEETT